MLNRLPKWPGEWADLLAEIGNPKPAQIAKALGVSKRTVERWNSTKPWAAAGFMDTLLRCEVKSVVAYGHMTAIQP